jgi:type I restriction enzyme M protein
MIHLLKVGGRAGIVLPEGSLTGDGVKQRVREKLLRDCNLHTIIRLPNSVFQPYATVATNLLFFDKVNGPNQESSEFATKQVWYYEHRMPADYKAYSKTKPIQLHEFDPIKAWWNDRKKSEVCWTVDIETIIERGFDLDIKNPNKADEKREDSSAELMEELRLSFERNSVLLSRLKEAL